MAGSGRCSVLRAIASFQALRLIFLQLDSIHSLYDIFNMFYCRVVGSELVTSDPSRTAVRESRSVKLSCPSPNSQDRISKVLGRFPRQIVAAVRNTMLVASGEHRRVARRAAGLERVA
jgi:hypothetical protein